MNKKYQVIALIGMSGAGKDTMLKRTCEAHPLLFSPIVSCTTRPMRANEVAGVDYHFISIEEFTHKVLAGDMLEATEFRNWFYGTPINSLAEDKINIGVFNPAGVEALIGDPRLSVLPVKINCDDKVRLMRCLEREPHPDCHEICRRFFADQEDFTKMELEEYAVVDTSNGGDADLLQQQGFRTDWVREMWDSLPTDVSFAAIEEWERALTIKAKSNNYKDNDE